MIEIVDEAKLEDAQASADHLVTLAILRVQGQYALQLRDAGVDIANPGTWGLFGGSVEPGEVPAGAVRRELHEELALDVDPDPCPFGVLDPDNEFHGGRVCALAFRADVTEVWDQRVLREGQTAELFDCAQLDELEPVAPISRAVLVADAAEPGRRHG